MILNFFTLGCKLRLFFLRIVYHVDRNNDVEKVALNNFELMEVFVKSIKCSITCFCLFDKEIFFVLKFLLEVLFGFVCLLTL